MSGGGAREDEDEAEGEGGDKLVDDDEDEAAEAEPEPDQTFYAGWNAPDGADTKYYLVKWRGLQYDGCTWESAADAGEAAVAGFEARQAVVAAGKPKLTLKESEDVPESFTGSSGRVCMLRDYQRDGVRWLRYNFTQGRSVILGDEMGLGKTAQSVTMLHCLRTFHAVGHPFLIVAPLSTIQHWQREVNDWTGLHGVIFHGNEDARTVLLDFEWASQPRQGKQKTWGDKLANPKFDVCITTYETFTACVEIFKKVDKWGYVVLDEAHRLKNKFGKALAAVQSLGRDVPMLALRHALTEPRRRAMDHAESPR